MQYKIEFTHILSSGKKKTEIQKFDAENLEDILKKIVSSYNKASIINITEYEYKPQRINMNLIPINECKNKHKH